MIWARLFPTHPFKAGYECSTSMARYTVFRVRLIWLQYADDFAVVMVTLCDYMMRKFQRRIRRKPQQSMTSSSGITSSDISDDDYEIAYLVSIEDALHSCRTKLKASHARSRIAAQVLSIDALLPSSVRKNDQLSSRMIVSAWVNFCKSRFADAIFTLISIIGQISVLYTVAQLRRPLVFLVWLLNR